VTPVLAKYMFKTGVLLGLFAVAGTALIAFTYDNTADRIAAEERAFLLRSIQELIPPSRYDNDPYSDSITVKAPKLLGSPDPIPVYRARKDGKPVAAVMEPVAPDGYGGAIKLLVAIGYDGSIVGVRVLNHQETPGLGDNIEIDKSDWITGFNGESLSKLDDSQWHVKKDGGVFDQFTGATITPRAVVKAVHNSLKYFSGHRDELFARKPPETETASHG
jgi:electron transport complex protein RnfG